MNIVVPLRAHVGRGPTHLLCTCGSKCPVFGAVPTGRLLAWFRGILFLGLGDLGLACSITTRIGVLLLSRYLVLSSSFNEGSHRDP